MKKIAIPVRNGDLCDHFEDLQYFLVYNLDQPAFIEEDIIRPHSNQLKNLPDCLIANGVSEIIARGISYEAIKQFNYRKIHVFVGAKSKNPDDLIMDYINKNLLFAFLARLR